jgi:hypothetical protein
MNKKLALICFGCAAAASGVALADGRDAGGGYVSDADYQGAYVGISVGQLLYREEGIDTLAPGVALVRFGEQFNRYIAVEGRVGTGLTDDSSAGYRVNVHGLYAAYAKGILPISPWISAYALAGVAGVQLHRNYPDFHTSDAGFSYGLGGEVMVSRAMSLSLEWARLTNGTNDNIYGYHVDQVTFGANWRL